MNQASRQKKFLSSLLILITLNIIIKPFWIFGIDRTVQNIVGSAEYGLYFALFNFSLLFNIFLDLGITNFNNREIAQHHHLLNKQFSGILTLKFILGVFYVLLTIISSQIFGYKWQHTHILLFLAFNQFLLSLILYLRSNISGMQMFKSDALLSILDRTLMIIFCSILIWSDVFSSDFSIEWFIYSQTLAYSVTALICFLIVIYHSGKIKLQWNWIFYIYILKKSLPFAILILLMTIYQRVDSVMIERLLIDGERHAGIYAAAFRILDAFNMIGYLFAIILLPLFARMIKQMENIYHIVKTAFSVLIVFSTFISLQLFFNSESIMGLLYIHHVHESAQVLRILILCLIPVSISYVFGTLLTASGELKILNLISASLVLVNLLLQLIFIPLFQTKGAASVSLLTHIIAATAQIFYVYKKFQLNFEKKYLILIAIFFIISIAITIICKQLCPNLLVNLIVSGIITFLLSIILGIIKPLKAIQVLFDKSAI